jgi:hypothetical protein
VGGKRVYKSTATLKKLCLRKAKALRKKLIKMHKKSMKHHKKTHRRRVAKTHRRRRGDAFGDDEMEMSFGKRRLPMFGNAISDGLAMANAKAMAVKDALMSFGRRRSRFGMNIAGYTIPGTEFGRRRRMGFGNVEMKQTRRTLAEIDADYGRKGKDTADFIESCKAKGFTPQIGCISDTLRFGKRRATKKVSKKAAMKAFRSFYKRHCAGRRSGFGNGGNPPLNEAMGYEFCPNGMGGVLGFNSTGLFPSPCISQGSSAPVQMGSLPPPTKVSEGGFGRRRRSTRRRVSSMGLRRRSAAGHKKRAHPKRRTPKRRNTAGHKKRCYGVGTKRRSVRR